MASAPHCSCPTNTTISLPSDCHSGPRRPEETVSGICRGEGHREDSPPPLRKSRTFSKKKIMLLTFIPIQCLSVK